MSNQVKFEMSYPDSQKVLKEYSKRVETLNKLAIELFENDIEQTRKDVNKLLFETAERLNISLYDLCFHTVPVIDEVEWSDELKACKKTISLAPIEFDLTHDGGYWKQKYYDLKKKVQKLVDEE